MPTKTHEEEKALYQSLTQGIANEKILSIKHYSNEDLRKILDYQDKLLNETGNATAFESIHENSISDLKKFAEGQLNIAADSYETMKEFIRIFGTDYKGELTPAGKAAQNKLNQLIEAKKQKILQHKKELLQKTQDKKKASPELLNLVESIRLHKEKETAENIDNDNTIEVAEYSFGQEDEADSPTVEYSFGMSSENETPAENIVEYSFGITPEEETAPTKINKKEDETPAPQVIAEKREEQTVPQTTPVKEKVVVEQNKNDDILDLIISGNADELNPEEIDMALGTNKNKAPKTQAPAPTPAPAPVRPAPAKPQKQPKKKRSEKKAKTSSKKSFLSKIKTWAIVTTVSFVAYLGLKSNKQQTPIEMPKGITEDVKPVPLPADTIQKPAIKQERITPEIDPLADVIVDEQGNSFIEELPEIEEMTAQNTVSAESEGDELALNDIQNDYQNIRNMLLLNQARDRRN